MVCGRNGCRDSAIALALLIGVSAIVLVFLISPMGPLYTTVQISGPLPTSPNGIHLASITAPLTMTMNGDLTGQIGQVYRIWSLSNQAHTVQTPLGLATFGGAIGDGFVYEVISGTQIVLLSVNNVVFL